MNSHCHYLHHEGNMWDSDTCSNRAIQMAHAAAAARTKYENENLDRDKIQGCLGNELLDVRRLCHTYRKGFIRQLSEVNNLQ